MQHLALAVRDETASRHFYETWFGFDAREPRRYSDGVLMLYNERGFALALGPHDPDARLPAFLHFGVALPVRRAVRELRDGLVAAGLEIVEYCDEDDYVSVKVRDPDGYVVEAAWEPTSD